MSEAAEAVRYLIEDRPFGRVLMHAQHRGVALERAINIWPVNLPLTPSTTTSTPLPSVMRQQRRIGCRHRLRGEESEGEPADCRSLPDDVGDVDFRLASPGITGDDQCAAKGKRRQPLADQPSADAIDDDIYALASGDAQDAVLEALFGKVDDMFISVRASPFCLLRVARGGNHQ